MAIDKKLLDILACPQCHSNVRWDENLSGLVCEKCKLLYEVKNDIPIMLVEEAKKLAN
jgi:uncharacterized protein